MRWVLLPGFDGTGMLFEPLLRELPPSVTPLVIDYPRDRKCSSTELLEIILSQLPQEEPYLLIAESFSGPLALRAAAQHSRPPKAIVLCASFGRCPTSRVLLTLFRPFVGLLMRWRPPEWIVRRYLLGDASRELMGLFYQAIASVSPQVLAHRMEVLRAFAVSEMAPIKSPLLYLQATRDRLIHRRCLRFLQEHYPAMTVEKIDSPHLLLQGRPRESVAAISTFAQRHC